MINAIEIYDDVIKDSINKWETAYASIDMFNRLSKRAELAIIDWLSGDVAGILPPEPWTTQKNRDWLSPFIVKFPASVDGTTGYITKPANYYKYDNYYRIGSKVDDDCDEPTGDQCDTPITILPGDKFNQRCVTYIQSKKPSFKKPIGKIIGNVIQVSPKDLGSVTLEYIRYPLYAAVGKTIDPVYNDEVPDPNNTTDYEWGEWARPALIYFITKYFSDHTREQALRQFNEATAKSPRG